MILAPSIQKGDLWTVVRISFPLMLFLFCETLTTYIERIWLAQSCLQGVHGSLNATYLASIFQTPCIAIATMGQVFVGLYQGSGDLKRIGPCVWQLIWFSLLSLIMTYPLGIFACEFYFKNSAIYQTGTQYFKILALGNFLFPLSTALSSFYMGRGCTLFVTSILVMSYALNLGFSWWMIPLQGVQGAALAKCISMGAGCAILWTAFLRKKHREVYGTGDWRFSPKQLWSYMRPGLIRGFGYLSSKIWWAGISYLMIQKGGPYLEVLTMGGTVITFLMFIASGLYRAILIISSNLLGAQKYEEERRLSSAFMIYIGLIGVVLVIPLLIYPHSLIVFFGPSNVEIFKMINHWIWLYMIAMTLQMSFCALIVSGRDLKLQFYCYLCFCVTSFFPVYMAMHHLNWQPDKLWAIMACENLFFAGIYFFRFRQKKSYALSFEK